MRFTKANGINIAYQVQGDGPPLVLIMGYRLNSSAWPATFIEQLARQFTDRVKGLVYCASMAGGRKRAMPAVPS